MTAEEERRLLGEKLMELAQKSKQLRLVEDELRVGGRRLERLNRSIAGGYRRFAELDAEERRAAVDIPRLLALLEERDALGSRVAELEKLRDGF